MGKSRRTGAVGGQFGDFVNGAQSIIDEFISSGEAKWGSSPTLFCCRRTATRVRVPTTPRAVSNGSCGCAEGSMTVALPSTPASYFHLLRRHVHDGIRRPLIVFTPQVDAAQQARRQPGRRLHRGQVPFGADDPKFATGADHSKVKRILLVSGKLFYELDERREKDGREDIAIVRVEQLYPFRTAGCARSSSSTPTRKTSCGCRRSRPTRVRGRSWVYGCPRCCRISSAVCAGIAPRDVGTVVGFEQGPRCGAEGNHRHRVRRLKPFRRLRCAVTGDRARQTW